MVFGLMQIRLRGPALYHRVTEIIDFGVGYVLLKAIQEVEIMSKFYLYTSVRSKPFKPR